MNASYFARVLILSMCVALVGASGAAQAQPAKSYEPQVGQEGKDVVWVPTPQALVDKMLDMAKVTPKDLSSIWVPAMAALSSQRLNAAPRLTASNTIRTWSS